jgi:hypothetical protein
MTAICPACGVRTDRWSRLGTAAVHGTDTHVGEIYRHRKIECRRWLIVLVPVTTPERRSRMASVA